MKYGKLSKYKNYGPIPQNEYTKAATGKDTDTAAVLGGGPQADDGAYRQRLVERQALHPAGRRKILGWARSWKANGWRAESAALQDELTDMGRCSGHVRKTSRFSLW